MSNKRALHFSTMLGLSALLLLFCLPPARQSALLLCNRLFALSQARNAYVYDFFSVPQDTSALPALALLFLCLPALVLGAWRFRPVTLLLAAALAVLQAVLGISLPVWANLLLFGALGFCLTRRRAVRILPILFAVLLGSALLFPGTNDAVEAASERVRDQLSLLAEETFDLPAESTPEALETRRENRLSLAEGGGQAQKNHAYRLQTQLEKQVSAPDLWNILRVALIVLLILALLIVPFLPFLAGSKRRKAEEALRARMKSDDSREAVCAMFPYIARLWLKANALPPGTSFSRLADELSMPEPYKAQYRACAAIWQSVVYGQRTPSEEQRAQIARLLEETERIFSSKRKA